MNCGNRIPTFKQVLTSWQLLGEEVITKFKVKGPHGALRKHDGVGVACGRPTANAVVLPAHTRIGISTYSALASAHRAPPSA